MEPHLSQAAARLAAAGCDSPRQDARLLWGYAQRFAVGHPTEQGEARSGGGGEAMGVKTPTEIFEQLVARRAAREPLAQILERKAFWSLDFYVNTHSLTPRPDSETLVEAALAQLADRQSPLRVLDLGTGSGCLLLALLVELLNATGLGVDCSPEALAVAARNAKMARLDARTEFRRGDWEEGITETFDMIVSNPPYIPRGDIAGLMPEVRDYEPHLALDGGEDGLDCYRRLTAALPALLKPLGHAVFEIGIGQAEAVIALGKAQGLTHKETRTDLNQIERVIVFANPRGS